MKTLIFILALYTTNLFAYQVYFSPKDDLMQVIVRHLDKAQQNIDMSIYTFNSNVVRSKLLEKVKSGVQLRMVIHRGKTSGVKNFIEPLIRAGAEIRYVSKINHHKFIVVDHEALYSSSGNFSDSARQASYDENSIVCADDCKRLVGAYQNEFEFLFTHSMNTVDNSLHIDRNIYTKQLNNSALFTTTNFTPTWKQGKISFVKSPENPSGNVATALMEAIEGAKKNIQVATGHFRSWPLYKALARAAKRGVNVELVLDSQEYISEYGQKAEDKKVKECMESGESEESCSASGVHFSRKVSDAGVHTYLKYYAIRWFFPQAPQMHSKYMIVDGKTVYTGSYNWSYNAEFNTFENIAIIHNRKTIEAYQANFHYLKTLRKENIDSFMQMIENSKKGLPMVFDAMALTVDQVDDIMTTYRKKCPDLYSNSLGTAQCGVVQ